MKMEVIIVFITVLKSEGKCLVKGKMMCMFNPKYFMQNYSNFRQIYQEC